MGGSISKQQKQQIATYRTKFLLGEPNLNLMKDEDLHENELKCRQVVKNWDLDQKIILNNILGKIESNADEIVDNNGILLCDSPLITNVLQEQMNTSNKYKEYLKEQEKLASQSLNKLETNQSQVNVPVNTSTTPVTATSTTTPVTTVSATPSTTTSTKPATTTSTTPVTTTPPPSDKTAKPTVESKKGGKSSSRKQKSLKLYY